jgi:5-methyltetrahydrofolate--homocysteine methyltransferase
MDSQKDKTFVSLAKARSKKLKTHWADIQITKPSFTGTKVFKNFDLRKVVEYIDWDPFFMTW